MKNLDKQHHGGINNVMGNLYEVDFAVDQLVKMLVQYGTKEKIVSLKRQCSGSGVDDVYCKTDKGNEYYFQCKHYIEPFKIEVLSDFLEQFQRDQSCNLILITKSQRRVLDTLAKDAKKYQYDAFIKRLAEDTQLSKCKDTFDSLCTKHSKKRNTEDTQIFVFEFLKKFEAKSFSSSEKDIVDQLTFARYTRDSAEKIYDRFFRKISEHEWLAIEINIDMLKAELESMDITPILPAKQPPRETPVILKRRKLPDRKSGKIHVLESPNATFTEKLSYILDLISNLRKPRPVERKEALNYIKKNSTLSWHLLHNLKDPNWFPEIHDTVIKSVIKANASSATKYQLLNYFEICSGKYSDDIIPLLIELGENTKNTDVLSALIKSIAKLEPSRKEKLRPIFNMLAGFVEHKHPWVRKEIPNTLKALAEYDLNKSLRLLKKLFLFNPAPRDVTRGSPTLALTFQGQDNENWVFEQSAQVLSQLMANSSLADKTLDLAVKLEIQFIRQSREKLRKASGITLDYSYIWLANEDPFGRLDYEYDKRKRLALEIEKCLDVFAVSDIELARRLFAKVLKANYEVLHLGVIKVLTRHPDAYLDFVEDIVFNKDLWVIRNIQNYFFQTLVRKYFEIKQDRLSEYIELAKSLNYKNNQKMTDHFKQDLFVSIPQGIRPKDVRQELKQLEKQLKVPATIEKPVIFTSFSGPRPDISLEELEAKDDDELVHIMENCTAGERMTGPYDLSQIFEELIKINPDRLPILLDKIKDKNIAQEFAGHMVGAYIEVKQSNLQSIIDLFCKLQDTDTWARQEVARLLDRKCRDKEIIKAVPELFEGIKCVLFDLASDCNPDDDETMKSSDPRPEDAVSRGINSVRGVTTEALVALAHYFPEDKEIADTIKVLSKDRTNAVKATLIYNLKYLIRTNYSLCKSIVKQFKDIRDPEIDFALIYYFAELGPRKFQANINFIKLLFNDRNKEIQRLLGELISTRYIHGCNLKQLIDGIIRESIGEVEVRRSLAFQCASRYAIDNDSTKQKRILDVLTQLIDPEFEEDINVRERASSLFRRSELKHEYFDMLYKSNVFDSILRDGKNIPAQGYVINYLEKCIIAEKAIDKCLDILHKQALNIDGIWNDQMIVQNIANMLKRIFESTTVDKKSRLLAEDIFDKGLERGWEEFYKLFYDFKQDVAQKS